MTAPKRRTPDRSAGRMSRLRAARPRLPDGVMDDETAAALALLTADGTPAVEAVRRAIRDAAGRLQGRQE